MWNLRTWATASNERAVANARAASTACSRRRVERDEVTLFLAGLVEGDAAHMAHESAEHPA